MRYPTIDIATLWDNYPDIFDKFLLPNIYEAGVDHTVTQRAMTTQEKEELIDNILFRTEGLEAVYTDPNILKNRIGVWSRIRKNVWEDYSRGLGFRWTYNPTENVFETTHTVRTIEVEGNEDNLETRAITNNEREDRALTKSSTETRNLTNSNTETRDLENGYEDTTTFNTSEAETLNLSDENTKTLNLEDETTETRAITGSQNRTLNTSDSQTISKGITETERTTTNDMTIRTPNLSHFETGSVINSENGYAGTDTNVNEGISQSNSGGYGTSGSMSLPVSNAQTKGSNSGDSGTETTDYDGDNTTTKSYSGSDTDITLHTGTDNLATTDGGTVTTVTGKTGTDTDVLLRTGTDTTNKTGTEKLQHSGTNTGTVTNSGTEGGTLGVQGTDGGYKTISGTEGGTVTTEGGHTENANDESEVNRHGNIGVTKASELINDQLKLIKTNLFELITNDFKHNMTLEVY